MRKRSLSTRALIFCLALTLAAFAPPAFALELRAEGNLLIATGRVESEDYIRFKEAFRLNPGLDTVVFWNSPGGDIWAVHMVGYRLRERKVKTVVHGFCYSACALLFLSGVERRFSDDGTSLLGFHGPFSVPPGMKPAKGDMRRFSRPAVGRLIDYMIDYTDGRKHADNFEKIMHRNEKQPFAMTYFVRPGRRTRQGTTMYLCSEAFSKSYTFDHCEKAPELGADVLGLVTSTEAVKIGFPARAAAAQPVQAQKPAGSELPGETRSNTGEEKQ